MTEAYHEIFSQGAGYGTEPLIGTMSGQTAKVNTSFVSNLAENALFPPNLPVIMTGSGVGLTSGYNQTGGIGKGITGYNQEGDSSQFFAVQGIQNSIRVFSAVRQIFGEWRVAPDICADPYKGQAGDVEELYVMMDFGYGFVELSDLKIGNTPISSFKGIDYKIWRQYRDQRPDFYRNDHATDNYNVEILTPWITRTAPAAKTGSMFVRFHFPDGLIGYYDGKNPMTAGVLLQVQFRIDGGPWTSYSNATKVDSSHAYTRVGGDQMRIEGRRTTAWTFWFRIQTLRPEGKVDFRVRRVKAPSYPNNNTPNQRYETHDKIILTELGSVTFRPPLHFTKDHTVIEFRIFGSEQVSGMLDSFSALARRHVPVWDGTNWTLQFSRNPAWVACEILRGDANPEPVTDDRIDLQSFKDWADWCDGMAAQGDARFRVDANMDSISTVAERLLSVMHSARASLTIRGGKYSVIWEHWPTDPVQVFTAANSWGFTGQRLWTRPVDGLKVEWIDPKLNYQQTEIIVYADGKDETNSQHFETISCPYCTRWEQAYRDGRYHMAVGKLRPETFSITTDIESLVCERGDLVRVQHDVPKAGGQPSRITAINGADITTREPVLWDATSNWEMLIRYDDGKSEVFAASGQVDHYTVTLATAPTKVKVGDLAVYGKQNKTSQDFLVRSISPGPGLTAVITLVPYSPAIQNADTGTIPPYKPPIADNIWNPACLTQIEIDNFLIYDDRRPYAVVSLSWEYKAYADHYEIWISEDGTSWKLRDIIRLTDYVLWEKRSTLSPDYPTNDFHIKVLPVSVFGTKPGLESCAEKKFTPIVDTTAPGKPLFFAGNVTGTIIHLTWLPPDDPDIAGYVLRYSPLTSGATWEDSTTERELIAYDIFSVDVNARVGTYLIKTIDTSGNYSVKATEVRTTVPELENMNVVMKKDQEPGFAGKKEKVEVKGTDLILSRIDPAKCGANDYGIYYFDNAVDLGDIMEVYLSALVEATGDFCPPVPTVSEGDEWDVMVQVRMASGAVTVMADWVPNLTIVNPMNMQIGGSGWSGWQRLTAGLYSGRKFEFRAILVSKDGNAWPVISKLSAHIDVPDRIEAGHDLDVAVGASKILFPGGPFMNVPAVATTHDNASDGDRLVITGIAKDGFTAEIFDKANHSVVGKIDYVAKGYGRQLTMAIPPSDQVDEDNEALLPGAIFRPTSPEIIE